MKRSDVLAHLRIAGYHDDTRSFVRLYTENRVSLAVANAEWRRGGKMKAAGVPCTCRECKDNQQLANRSVDKPGALQK